MPKPFDLLIHGGTVVTPVGVLNADLAVTGERIAAIGALDGLPAQDRLDARGLIVMPGGVDPHAHVEQKSGMGLWNADTFETAHLSAAMGGTTTVVSFAAQARGERLRDTVAAYTARADRGAMVDHAFHLTLTDLSVPDLEADIAALTAAGHRSFKVFTTYDIALDDAALLRVLRLAKAHDALVCVHAENDAIIAEARAALLAEGRTAPRDHARSRPRMAEIEAVARTCRLAEHTGQPVMVFHVSTAEAAAEIRAARARGAPVMAETCPHYLLMTEEVLDRPAGAKWMCSPPQRDAADQAALWEALADGTLDLVSSDHAPYRMDETGKMKDGPDAPFPAIANGLPGLEVRLPLMFDAMVTQGHGGPAGFARLTAGAPARLHRLPRKGALAPGMDADIVLWDPERRVTYGADDLHDNAGYNPWEGTTVTGWPVRVVLRGRTIVRDGTATCAPGTGRWIARPGGDA